MGFYCFYLQIVSYALQNTALYRYTYESQIYFFQNVFCSQWVFKHLLIFGRDQDFMVEFCWVSPNRFCCSTIFPRLQVIMYSHTYIACHNVPWTLIDIAVANIMSCVVVYRRDIMFPDCPSIRPSRFDEYHFWYSAYLMEPSRLNLDNA